MTEALGIYKLIEDAILAEEPLGYTGDSNTTQQEDEAMTKKTKHPESVVKDREIRRAANALRKCNLQGE